MYTTQMLKRVLRILRRIPRQQPARHTPAQIGGAAGFPKFFALEVAPGYASQIRRGATEVAVTATPLSAVGDGVYGIAVPPGGSIDTPALDVSPEHELALSVVVQDKSCLPTAVSVQFLPEGGLEWCSLSAIWVGGPNGVCSALRIPVRGIQPGSRFRVSGGDHQFFVVLLRICPREQVGRVNAQTTYRFRMANEVSNFSGQAYTHRMYGDNAGNEDVRGPVKSDPIHALRPVDQAGMRNSVKARLEQLPAERGETAFVYAMRALGSLLPITPPNFFERIARLNEAKPLRVLSIMAGAARIEQQLVESCKGAVELTLMDASPDLIGRAAGRLTDVRPGVRVECLVGDVNAGLPGECEFDIVVCVSALHHVANLENVLTQINDRLTLDGEFWSIGEQIGRNGNRLWPEALAVANEAFGRLPERLRKNAHTGKVDLVISDRDYSHGCFEGIRSEELETLLEAYMVPHDVYKRNAFLWRLVDATYSDNFNLEAAEDLNHLRDLVVAEAIFWSRGGRSTEMHGVFRKKYLEIDRTTRA
ncbi:MAG: class I SAM-dependent methyltransferase [Betaproteobacteria bacterium]